MDKDAMDRGLERLLVEEQERAEIEMRADTAAVRLGAGDRRVTVFEVWGDPYNRIHAINDVRRASRLPFKEAKAFVKAHKWDLARTIEAAIVYSRREMPQHLDLKPSMSTKDWLEIRVAIEAEPDSKPTAARRRSSISTCCHGPQGTPTSASAARTT